MLAGDGFDGIYLGQDFTGDPDNFKACRSHLSQVLTATGENLDAQFIFQHPHLLADTGL
ncbi:hypothetical protein D3C85_1849230 [compost metagenome]